MNPWDSTPPITLRQLPSRAWNERSSELPLTLLPISFKATDVEVVMNRIVFPTILVLCLAGLQGCQSAETSNPEATPEKAASEEPNSASSVQQKVIPEPQKTLLCSVEMPKDCLSKGMDHLEKKEMAQALQAFQFGCDGKVAASCGEVGKLIAQGFGGSPDPQRALDHYLMGCSGGHKASCTFAGRLVSSTALGDADGVAALAFYEQACAGEDADPQGCELHGLNLMRGEGGKVDFMTAYRSLERSCTAGRSDGCHHLGTLYADGLGVAPDAPKALQLHEKACDGGTVEACASAGVMLQRGLGVTKDLEKAIPMLVTACTGGNRVACAAEREAKAEQAKKEIPAPAAAPAIP